MEEPAKEGLDPNSDPIHLLRRSLVSRNKQTILVRSPDGVTEFCCVECPMRYTDKESMELHLCMHNKEYRFICTVCGTGLKRREHLERHMAGHQEIRPYSCDECDKAFKRREHLSIHRAIHTGERNLNCPMCDRCFHRKDHLQKHIQSHSNKFKKQGKYSEFQVKIEPEEQWSETHDIQQVNLQENIQYDEILANNVGQSDDPLRPFACLICSKTYKRKDHLKLHTQTHVKTVKSCSQCGKGFQSDEQLLWHMNTHVKKESLLVSEDVSTEPEQLIWQDDDADTSSLLVPRRSQNVSQNDQRPHECAICHKRFKRKQHLKVHSNVHNKSDSNNLQLCDLTIWCSICHSGFRTNEDFEVHHCMQVDGNSENIHEEQNPIHMEGHEEYLENDEPDVEYNQPIIQLSEEEPALPVPQRVFVCKYCSKPFRRRDHYKIHLNIHTGHKSFFCPDCGKGFYRKDHLQKHLMVHKKKSAPPRQPPPLRQPPALLPINQLTKTNVLPEITIHAPSSARFRMPLQMKVPYEVVTSTETGEHRTVVNPLEDQLSH